MSTARQICNYKLGAVLEGHTQPIFSIAVSNNGKVVASGGELSQKVAARLTVPQGLDRVQLWDLGTMAELQTPEKGYFLRGSSTCMLWAKRRDDQRDVLVFGTSLGYLVFWQIAKVSLPANSRVVGHNEIILRGISKSFPPVRLQTERR